MNKLTLPDILILGLTLVFIIIGVDQSMAYGFNNSYWAFMLSLTLFFVYNLRKNKQKAKQQNDENMAQKPRKPRSGK